MLKKPLRWGGRSASLKLILLCTMTLGGAMAATLLLRGGGASTPTLPTDPGATGSTPTLPSGSTPVWGGDGADANHGEPGLDERPANTTCHAPERPVEQASVSLVKAIPNVGFAAIGVVRAPHDPSKWYLIDRTGTVARRWDAVKVEAHPAEVLDAVQALPR